MKYDVKTSLAFVKHNVKINDVLSKLGIEYKNRNKYHILSPFTEEKTPSCYINTETNTFKCYSSGDKYGDVLNFVRYYHGFTLYDTFTWFESNFGLDLPKREPTKEERQLEVYYRIHKKAAEFFHGELRKNERSYEYISSRISDKSIDRFLVGYSRSELDLVEYLTDIGHDHKDLVALGLASTNQFNGSIRLDDTMAFPVWDMQKNICRFHFRTNRQPKYVGSPGSSPIFQHVLYGLNFAERDNDLILVEGQFDVIACHEKGIKNVAALLGTNYLHQYGRQAEERGYRRLVFCLDGDKAGRNAALKLARTRIKIPSLFAAIKSDPGETRDTELREAISKAKTPVEFYVDSLQIKEDGASSKKNFLLKIREDLRNIDNLDKRLIVERLAHDLQLPEDEVAESIICKDVIQDLSIEQHCLYMAIEDPVWFKNLLSLTEDHFTTQKHKAAFVKIKNYARLHSYSKDAILRYLDDLTINSNQNYEIEFCIKDLQDKYHRRNALDKLKQTEYQLYDIHQPLDGIIANFRAGIQLYSDVYSSSPEEDIQIVQEELYDRLNKDSLVIGHPLGNGRWEKLDEQWLGLQKGRYYGVGANTGVGKSVCGVNWFQHLTMQLKIPCLYITGEMHQSDIIRRAVSIDTSINNTLLQLGRLNQDQLFMVEGSFERYKQSPAYVVKPKYMTSQEWLALIDYYYYKHGVETFFVDYIQLVQPSSDQSRLPRHEVIGNASSDLQQRAQQPGKEVSIVAMIQLNTQAIKSVQPQKEETGGAYKIAQDLDNYLMIKIKTRGEIYEQGIQHGNIKLYNVKNRGGREGQTWNAYIDNGTYGTGNLRMGMLEET